MTVSMPAHEDTILFKPGSDLLLNPEHPSQHAYLWLVPALAWIYTSYRKRNANII